MTGLLNPLQVPSKVLSFFPDKITQNFENLEIVRNSMAIALPIIIPKSYKK